MKNRAQVLATLRQLLEAGEQAKARKLFRDLALRNLSKADTLEEIADVLQQVGRLGLEAAGESVPDSPNSEMATPPGDRQHEADLAGQADIPMSFAMPFLQNALLENQVPEGDASAFVERHTRESQIKALSETLSRSEEFASDLYDNGVRIRPELLAAAQPRNYPASPGEAAVLDAWYCRGVDWPPSTLSKQLASIGRALPPVLDDERARLKEFCKHLCKTSPAKERLLDGYLPVWHASNLQEVCDIVQRIKQSGAYDIENHDLWFRGQDQDHRLTRSPAVRDWLHYPADADSEPSVLPSLARLTATKSPPRIQALERESTTLPWAKAFMIWGLSRHSSLGRGSQSRLRRILEDDNLLEMENLLSTIKRDSAYERADGFRLEFFTHHKYHSLRLVLQHYGLPTSCLDITRNVEVALFFALHKFDSDHFVPVAGRSRCFLSVFAGSTKHAGSKATSARSSEDLLRRGVTYPLQVPLRVERQQCGLLYGADVYGRNRYADLMIGKICLDGFDSAYQGKSQSELFPRADEDELYDVLLRCRPAVPNLVIYKN